METTHLYTCVGKINSTQLTLYRTLWNIDTAMISTEYSLSEKIVKQKEKKFNTTAAEQLQKEMNTK